MPEVAACSFPGCGRPVFAVGLCAGHYQRQRKGQPMVPLGTAKGDGDRVAFAAPKHLREEAMAAALAEGISEGEWWRRAGAEKLERKKHGQS